MIVVYFDLLEMPSTCCFNCWFVLLRNCISSCRFFSSTPRLSCSRFSMLSHSLLSSLNCFSSFRFSSSSFRMASSCTSFPASAMIAFRVPKATLDSYSVWYALNVMSISSRIRSRSKPLSAPSIVICRISSLNTYKHESF